LYTRLLDAARKAGVHTLVAGICLPNKSSAALHEKFGFKKIGCFREVGFKQNKWLDVGYWELIL